MKFFKDISKDMAKNMSSWDSFYHMSKTCSKANMAVEETVKGLKRLTKINTGLKEEGEEL